MKSRKVIPLVFLLIAGGGLWWSVALVRSFVREVPGQQAPGYPRVLGQQQQEQRPGPGKLLTLFFVGDTGFGNNEQAAVAARMEKECQGRGPAAVVLLGDNFYPDGVSGTDDPQWSEKFETMYSSPCLLGLPFYAVLGNHDVRKDPGAQIDYTAKGSGRWHMPARYYGLVFGDLLKIAMIDSNWPDYCGFSFCGLDQLATGLERHRARWTLVAGHHPLLSGGKYRRPAWFRGQFLKRFYCRVGADAYLAGHDHNLQSLVAPPGGDGLSCGARQLIAGGGGAPLYPVRSLDNLSEFAREAHGFVSGTFSEAEVVFDFIDIALSEVAFSKVIEAGVP